MEPIYRDMSNLLVATPLKKLSLPPPATINCLLLLKEAWGLVRASSIHGGRLEPPISHAFTVLANKPRIEHSRQAFCQLNSFLQSYGNFRHRLEMAGPRTRHRHGDTSNILQGFLSQLASQAYLTHLNRPSVRNHIGLACMSVCEAFCLIASLWGVKSNRQGRECMVNSASGRLCGVWGSLELRVLQVQLVKKWCATEVFLTGNQQNKGGSYRGTTIEGPQGQYWKTKCPQFFMKSSPINMSSKPGVGNGFEDRTRFQFFRMCWI